MAKKDAKAKAAERKARAAAKQSKKTAKSTAKASRKSHGADTDSSDDESVDLDAVLASYAAQQERFLAVSETPCEPPSVRGSPTLLANPQNGRELLLFGGESFDGLLARFFNDLFVYNTKRDTWALVSSANAPLNRSGHAWCAHPNSKLVYLFGGEFSSPKQGTFYHYSDFWCLDPGNREWTKIEPRGKSPSARSGHRVVGWKTYVLLFGGFRDTSGGTTYLNDTYIFDTANQVWHAPIPPSGTQRPDPRSSFSFLPHEQGAMLFGGYSRAKKVARSRTGASKVTEQPIMHQDVWMLRVSQAASASDPPSIRWEKRKRPANAPNPPRAGATMTSHKGRGVGFGGVWDTESSEERLESEFFNDLSVWNVERNRWFNLNLRRPRAKRGDGAEKTGRAARKRQGDEELLDRLKQLEAEDETEEEQGKETVPSDGEEQGGASVEKPVMWEMPHPRFNAQLAVQNDVLYIYGGTYEKGDKEFMFDEMWMTDLGKLDGCRQIFRREIPAWGEEEAEEEEGEEEEEEDEEAEEEPEISSDEASMEDAEIGNDLESTTDTTARSEILSTPATSVCQDQDDQIPTQYSLVEDHLPHPRPFESLRGFYARTTIQWQELLQTELGHSKLTTDKSVKEIKKLAFKRAEDRWWDCREEIQALEAEQEEAGIGEVVNLQEKTGNRGTDTATGRRR
ncbi:MAG: hypothetical protein Q9162_007129 [Coniocarpon cinnabarinum]